MGQSQRNKALTGTVAVTWLPTNPINDWEGIGRTVSRTRKNRIFTDRFVTLASDAFRIRQRRFRQDPAFTTRSNPRPRSRRRAIALRVPDAQQTMTQRLGSSSLARSSISCSGMFTLPGP